MCLWLLNLLGNAQTLMHEPREKNIDIYQCLREFWKRHYSAQYMTLALQSKGLEVTQKYHHYCVIYICQSFVVPVDERR